MSAPTISRRLPVFSVPLSGGGVRVCPSRPAWLGGLPSLGAVSRLACCQAASFFSCRPSSRALGGFVAVAGFRRAAAASLFAARWAVRLPFSCRGCVVRSSGGFWLVSVPVLACSVPALVAGGVVLSVFGAPPFVRRVVASSSAWGVLPAAPPSPPAPAPPAGGGPGARRRLLAASLALGFSPSLFSSPPGGVVGFCGSRALPSSFAPLVGGLVRSVLAGGLGVSVGCAAGADQLVRSACPGAAVFRASGRGARSLVLRSVAFVRSLARSGPVRGLVVLPGCACPGGLLPCSVPSRCFCGLGSGSWASAALAAGLGVPVLVFGVPPSFLPPSWGAWVPAAPSGPWAGGFRLLPAAPRLF